MPVSTATDSMSSANKKLPSKTPPRPVYYAHARRVQDNDEDEDDGEQLGHGFSKIHLVDDPEETNGLISDETLAWVTINGRLTKCRILQTPLIKGTYTHENCLGEPVKVVLVLSQFLSGFAPDSDLLASGIEEDGRHIILVMKNPKIFTVCPNGLMMD
jgi:hypothetical protein